ncbi:Aminopeptidase N [Folsomia candida]|uniref:Aminopeptidase n=1 Tax=Folsomia candida TaxID=158441 RepID=A0A226ELN8_FOLCA|nr:Aminopeptidase N [Folsomia candida]
MAAINTNSLDGLYLSNYTDTDETIKRIATTQMQAYHARQLFPCFDEPGLKAVFNLKIIHKTNYTTVLGNSDVANVTEFADLEGWSVTTFNPTVPMATYLFAMVVSDLEYAEADGGLFKVPVRTYAPPPVVARNGATYSADIAAKMEAYIIYYPGESLESYKNLLTSVVSHELAHQNFGNLVTCKWWNELWLNEGFATYISYLGVDGVRPEFRHREWILNDAFQYSMRVDVSARSHPIVNDAVTPDEVDSYFTGITYEKGGSVNRMTEKFLSEATYKKGLQYYLHNMSYQGVVSDDLFHYLNVAAQEDDRLPAGVTVKMILDSWTLQKSHPLVRVSAEGPNSVYISQERYADPASVDLWWVPVTVVTQDAPSLENWVPKLWLERDVPIKSVVHDTSKWIMINQDATGYYRVLYDEGLTPLIADQLRRNASVITPLSRSQLLDDYFNLAYRGNVEIEAALEFTKYLEQEDHFTVWEVIFTQLRQAYNFAQTEDEHSAIRNYLAPKIRPALEKIGLEQNNNVHIGALGILRTKLIDWSCALGDSFCVDYANKLYTEWGQDVNKILPIDIQASITCAIVANNGQAGFDFMMAKYIATPMQNPSKVRYLNALGCSRDAGVLQTLLGMTLDTNSQLVRSHALSVIQRVAMNKQGRRLVIQFLKDQVDRIISILGSGSPSPVSSILSSLSSYVSTQEELDEVLKFVADHAAKFGVINGSINSYLTTIRSNIAWKVTFGKPIISWMGENVSINNSASYANPSLAVFVSLVTAVLRCVN